MNPRRIATYYPTAEAVVADMILTEAPYFADPTGVQDATEAIRQALSDLDAIGGGTAFLPAGQYRLSGSIRIPGFCSLIGDWQDPRTGSEYGTVILADVPSIDAPHPALFDLAGSAGVMGLTVYYPNQSLTHVKPYPFAFYCRGGMLASVQNCTVLNGYRGLGACVAESNAHEQFTVDGFYGTFLYEGAEVYDQSDVGTWKNVEISPRFWAQAGERFGAPSLQMIREYTYRHTVGLRLGDLEWTEFAGLTVSDCRIGMQIVKGHRIEFAGSVWGANITRCEIGLRVDAIDARWGMVLAGSVIDGDWCAILHNAAGAVKMTGVQIRGLIAGNGEIIRGEGTLPVMPDFSSATALPAMSLAVFDGDRADCADALQALLDRIGTSGGVVYLPSGVYRLNRPITVPAGVELRGSSIPVRGQGGERGMIILTDLLGDKDTPALITLAGKGARIAGIQIIWNKNGPHNLHKTPYAIRGEAEEVACVNCCIVASTYGVDFSGCDRHLIKKLTCCCYENAILAGGRDGIIEGCLQNGTAITRAPVPEAEGWLSEDRIFQELFPVTRMGMPPRKLGERMGPPPGIAFQRPGDHGRPHPERRFGAGERKGCVYLRVSHAQGETVYNTFAYGVGSLLSIEDSEQVVLCNLGADNIAHPQMLFRDSSVIGVNLMRYNGSSYEAQGGQVSLLNRLTILDKHEENFGPSSTLNQGAT